MWTMVHTFIPSCYDRTRHLMALERRLIRLGGMWQAGVGCVGRFYRSFRVAKHRPSKPRTTMSGVTTETVNCVLVLPSLLLYQQAISPAYFSIFSLASQPYGLTGQQSERPHGYTGTPLDVSNILQSEFNSTPSPPPLSWLSARSLAEL